MSKAFHRKFKTHCRRMGYTLRYVAKSCGVSPAYISKIMNDKTATLNPETLTAVHARMQHIMDNDEADIKACIEWIGLSMRSARPVVQRIALQRHLKSMQ
ncbi:MAG: helix-turn-helix transcriptional regulator [Bacteroidia bacterium]|nr:helix-turn-helix transcriptional regulator [Bacteroidia bacterium]